MHSPPVGHHRSTARRPTGTPAIYWAGMTISGFTGVNGFLSNFHENDLWVAGWKCPSGEHAFQVAKAVNAQDFMAVAGARSPREAKRVGRRIWLRDDWDAVKLEVMRIVVERKFSDVGLRSRLMATGTEHLVETNQWHDNYWGNCECTRCSGTVGLNQLGELLMERRSLLRTENTIGRFA